MGSFRDGYSNFGFFDAMTPASQSAALDGRTIDRQGYEAVTFIVTTDAITSGAATSDWALRLEHGLASADGVSAWSAVPNSLLIHSVAGGYDSTAETGIFQTIQGVTGSGTTYACGYKGDKDHRYVRLVLSETGVMSATIMAGWCVLGEPATWPVNTPI